MASATKTPPMIAPGIICPKCKGAMLDERANKRTDKSPDYTCANMLCVEIKNGKTYRTSVWATSNGSAGGEMGKPNAGTPSAAPSVEPAKPKMRDAYKSITEWVIKEILPLYDAEFESGAVTPEVVAACCQTLFIQACQSGKVE